MNVAGTDRSAALRGANLVRTIASGLYKCVGAKIGTDEEPAMVRRLLQREDLQEASRFKGQQVELFWPEDATWWLARIIKVWVPLSFYHRTLPIED